jgi:hypothetical protein
MASKPAHYAGDYQARAAQVRAAANANPETVCWRCGLYLDQHAPHASGAPVAWQAGHVHDGDPLSPLLPEASTCNSRAGRALQSPGPPPRHIVTTRDW